jgi:hypothetical protein
MSLITEYFGVKSTEEIANQNASGKCKQKDMNSPKLMHRLIFSFRCLVSVLYLKPYTLASKDAHQSEKLKVCYAVMSTG